MATIVTMAVAPPVLTPDVEAPIPAGDSGSSTDSEDITFKSEGVLSFTVQCAEAAFRATSKTTGGEPSRPHVRDSKTSKSSKDFAVKEPTSERQNISPFFQRTQSSSLQWIEQVSRTLTSSLESMTRHTHSNLEAVVPTKRCSICLESFPAVACVVPRACGREAHCACVQCMSVYMRLRIEEGRVSELWCPCAGSDGCDAKVADCEVDEWLAPTVAEKYRRFTRMREDSKLRACPKCNELCRPQLKNPKEANSQVVPEMTCGKCGCNFCFFHSNAHPPGAKACALYESQVLKQERKAAAKVNAQKCPRCGVMTEKTSGCNHMSCKCGCQWCWVCGQEITNVGWHYHPLKPLSCARYNDRGSHPNSRRFKVLMTMTKSMTWPGAVGAALLLSFCPFIFVALVLVELVPVCATCWCCCLACRLCFEDFEIEDSVRIMLSLALVVTLLIIGIPFAVFSAAWCVIAVLLWLFLLPLGARISHLTVVASAPVMTVLTSLECIAPDSE